MNPLLESLRSYFQNNSIDKIREDWEKYEKYDEIGPSVEEYLCHSEKHNKLNYYAYSLENSLLENKIENPKFASDFFFNFT
ncbi:hypothetical protein [Tenacibaculum aiptasiae]|uniref:hypothetical protein n=1 Tax=Tenacibaculum aiptasiae TaxID=426481 RepID=UPI002330E166|nr:hypothetical protein [Tenacibaculum aiptasiae]